jgi:NAD(P)-dependent dehydrogenase (short-subunit alcohol dehydrogenase family)
VRLLLDNHISGRRVGQALRRLGHDVRAADEEEDLQRFGDEQLLALAASERRLMVTCDVGDFASITGAWAQVGRRHAGCAILVGIRNNEFGSIVRQLEQTLIDRPKESDWIDHVAFVSRRH